MTRHINHVCIWVCGNREIIEREGFDPQDALEVIEGNLKAQGLFVPAMIVCKQSAWGPPGKSPCVTVRVRLNDGSTAASADGAYALVARMIMRSIGSDAPVNYPSSEEIGQIFDAIKGMQ